MDPTPQILLNLFIYDIGHHEAAWRLPESDPHGAVDIDHYITVARLAEAGLFDSIFLADIGALPADHHFRPSGTLEPDVVARGARRQHGAHRPDLDRVDDLQRAV